MAAAPLLNCSLRASMPILRLTIISRVKSLGRVGAGPSVVTRMVSRSTTCADLARLV